MQEKLGVDVGGVIIDGAKNDDTDTSFFTDNYLSTTVVDGAFDALRSLVDSRFGKNVFIVSKCGVTIERKTREWFAHHRFYERTGIVEENIRFCRSRLEKAPICRDLGITHFIDDRLGVLFEVMEVVPHSYLFNPTPESVNYVNRHFPSKITPVTNWNDVLSYLVPERG